MQRRGTETIRTQIQPSNQNQVHRFHTYMHNGGIKYDFPFNSIRKVPREVFKPGANLEVFNTSRGTLRIDAGSLWGILATFWLNLFSAPSWVLNHNQRTGIHFIKYLNSVKKINDFLRERPNCKCRYGKSIIHGWVHMRATRLLISSPCTASCLVHCRRMTDGRHVGNANVTNKQITIVMFTVL